MNNGRLPLLVSLTLVAAVDMRQRVVVSPRRLRAQAQPLRILDRRIQLDRVHQFSELFRPSPQLQAFHFCALDGCRSIRGWGQQDEVVEDKVRLHENALMFFAE